MALPPSLPFPVSSSALTRQNLLSELDGYSTSRLAELVRLAKFIFLPDESQLVNVTMADMVKKAHDLADVYFPQWTDRSKADFGEFLIELFALFSEKDFFYINGFALEGYLQDSTMYSNLIKKAMSNGYYPNLYNSASGIINVQFSPGSEYIVLPGQIIVNVPGTGLRYSNTENILVPATATPYSINAKFSHGVYRTDNVNFNGRFIRITTTMVDLSSVSHYVNGDLWERVYDFSFSSSSDRHYMLMPEENGSFLLLYGNGTYGSRPALGAATSTTYRTGAGEEGNVDVGAVSQLSSYPPSRTVSSVTQLTKMSGGKDADSLEDIRAKASTYYRTQGCIRNVRDCKEVLEEFADVHKATAVIFSNKLWFYVIPINGYPATQEFLDELYLRIKDQVVSCYRPGGVLTQYIPVSFDCTAYILTGYDSSVILNQLTEFAKDYTNPMVLAEYGKDFDLGDFTQRAVEQIEGLQNIVFNTVNGGAPGNVEVSDTQIIAPITDPDINITIQVVS